MKLKEGALTDEGRRNKHTESHIFRAFFRSAIDNVFSQIWPLLPLALARGKCLIFHIGKKMAKLFVTLDLKCIVSLISLSLSIIAAESFVNSQGS